MEAIDKVEEKKTSKKTPAELAFMRVQEKRVTITYSS